jgi:glutamine synthetase
MSGTEHASDRRTVSPAELEQLIQTGEIETVITCFPDMQGRLMGKRITGDFYLKHASGPEAFEGCVYLVATDMDQVPIPGFDFANYATGYGDMRAVGDPSTIRIVPWLHRTALVMCNLTDVDTGDIIEVSPRAILQRQVLRAAEMGMKFMLGSEIEFFLFEEDVATLRERGFRSPTPTSPYSIDYSILGTQADEPILAQLRMQLPVAGVPIEFSKGEAEAGQHELNLRYTSAVEMADRNAIFKEATKIVAAQHGKTATFMAKYAIDRTGSSGHIHASVYDIESGASVLYDESGPHHMSKKFHWFLGGLIATAKDFSLLNAQFVNSYKRYQPGSWAPTAIAWGSDNRTCGYRVVGHGQALRVESRVPGADMNSYLSFAGVIAAGLYGIANQIEPPAEYQGNGYEAHDVERIPWNITDAIRHWRESEIARSVFGPKVHHHIANLAEQEWISFNKSVTDWETRRMFERA